MINTYDELQDTAIELSYALQCAGKTYTPFPFLGSQALIDSTNAYFRQPLKTADVANTGFSLYEFELICGINVVVIVYKKA